MTGFFNSTLTDWRSTSVWTLLLLTGLSHAAPPIAIRPQQLDNWFAYIPPSCYVDTEGQDGRIHNPCYICHQKGVAPNYIDDSDLQLEYSFAAPAITNYWSNLWQDRRPEMARISDTAIAAYVQTDNYMADGKITIAETLTAKFPKEWDSNHNGTWEGYIPDVFYNLDADGFDHDPQGNYNGWRQYQYAPLPGNFSPVNGSAGDGFIRLGEEFRVDKSGRPDLQIYKLNLAIVESAISRQDIVVGEFHERDYGVDLDHNGELNSTATVAYRGEPGAMKLVGKAGELQSHAKVHLEQGLFPEFTEFYHSLRYLDGSEKDGVKAAPRVKEIRYSIKKRWYPPAMLARFAADEAREKAYTPDRPRWVRGNQEFGVSNALAWQYQGFIEDRDGWLRPQTHEELVFCVGCHGGIGATTDSNFSFPRKLPAGQVNYFADSTSKSLHKNRSDVVSYQRDAAKIGAIVADYGAYLQHNRYWNDYRNLGERNSLAVDKESIGSMLWPDAENAQLMNKAYRVIVQEQSYTKGRDAIVSPLLTIRQEFEKDEKTGIEIPINPL
jgi:hypothetical protein